MRLTPLLTALAIALIANPLVLSAQPITQTVRGTIVDADSNAPLIGASILVIGSQPMIGAVTDLDGSFRLDGVPIGRVNLKITSVGYEDKIIPNLLINSAKEELLSVTLTESVSRLDEIVISANDTKGESINEMALISAHTFTVEETQRYAGSFDDPARMVSAFAGVVGNPEGNNDIIVRGNSPKGILWRLEGVAIPNPNHFAGEGSTGGPINALSSKMLSNSDFFTGAFSAEYGDVTSGVFDMRLKNGNNEKREYTATLSTLGIDVTAEGPFQPGKRSSYLVNYRYSALDLLDRAGIVDFGGVPRYQDASFKVHLPISRRHHLSVFGLGGMSGIDTEDKDEDDEDVVVGRFDGDFGIGVLGATHTFQINDNAFIRTTAATTHSTNAFTYGIPHEGNDHLLVERGDMSKSTIVGASAFNYKLSAQHKLESGIIFTRHNFSMRNDEYDFQEGRLVNYLDERGGANVFQAYGVWKYRINEELTMVNGLHYLQFGLNNASSVEPRVALRWSYNERQAFNVGFGIHSKLEPVSAYLVRTRSEDGSVALSNQQMDVTKAAHFVLGHDRRLSSHTHLKAELYYQQLYNVPVEDSVGSTFSLINEMEGFTTRRLVNEGKGRNYGVELTLERYLHRGLYYMATASLFRSLYTPMDGIERKSAFDNNYVANLIGGKEFPVGSPAKNKVLFLNTKVAIIGGKRYTKIDREASAENGWAVEDEQNPFGIKGQDIFRTDFSIGLRRNRPRTTTELKFDVQNIFNNQAVLGQYYVHATRSVRESKQLGMLPSISYKISF